VHSKQGTRRYLLFVCPYLIPQQPHSPANETKERPVSLPNCNTVHLMQTRELLCINSIVSCTQQKSPKTPEDATNHSSRMVTLCERATFLNRAIHFKLATKTLQSQNFSERYTSTPCEYITASQVKHLEVKRYTRSWKQRCLEVPVIHGDGLWLAICIFTIFSWVELTVWADRQLRMLFVSHTGFPHTLT